MRNADLYRTLSGCRFYRAYVKLRQAGRTEPKPRQTGSPGGSAPRAAGLGTARQRIFRKYAAVLGAMVLGSAVLVVLPMWLAYAPFGKACLLSLPPMLVCAASWMAGAWWGREKPSHVLVGVTLGLIPLRVLMVLGWAWLVLQIPGMPVEAFFLALMFHWIVFACAEVGMLVELSHLGAPQAQTGRMGRIPENMAQRPRTDGLGRELRAPTEPARQELAPVLTEPPR